MANWALSCDNCVAASLRDAKEVIMVDDIATPDIKPS
jgi:hypothetical protein